MTREEKIQQHIRNRSREEKLEDIEEVEEVEEVVVNTDDDEVSK